MHNGQSFVVFGEFKDLYFLLMDVGCVDGGKMRQETKSWTFDASIAVEYDTCSLGWGFAAHGRKEMREKIKSPPRP